MSTLTEPQQPTRERSWSPSSAAAYDTCPQLWAFRYGPHQIQRIDAPDPVPAARGTVLHAAISAAYEAAAIELTATPGGLGGARMDRYWPAARRALGVAWDTQRMPSDPHEALHCTRILRQLLEKLPVPPPGRIYGIEHRTRGRTPGGLLVTIVPDLILWTGKRGTILVRDWKHRSIDPADVANCRQLLIYAGILAELDPSVTGVRIELHSISTATGHTEPATPERVSLAIARLERTAATAEADTDPQPTPGPHCPTCPYIRICPAHGGKA